MRTIEEQVLRSYIDAFNAHDIDAVLACFDTDPVIVDMFGQRQEGREQIRHFYEKQFAMFADARCDIKTLSANAAAGMAETEFHGTHAKTGKSVTANGAEVVTFHGHKIRALRDYHRLISR